DLFDTFNPSSEAEELLYKTLKDLTKNGTRAVVAIAGNHDSPERIEAPDPLARACGIIFAGYPNSIVPPFALDTGLAVLKSEEGFVELQIPGVDLPLRLLLTPYANEYRLKKFLGFKDADTALRMHLQQHWEKQAKAFCDEKGINILIAHLFFAKENEPLQEEPDSEKPILHVGGAQAIFSINVPDGIDYVALGHLHRRQTVADDPCPMVYSGSPLSYSFAEANQQKGVMLLEFQKDKTLELKKIPLTSGRPLLRKRFEEIDVAANWLAEHPNAIVELTLVMEEYLSAQEKNRLLEINPDLFIVPELKGKLLEDSSIGQQIDLSQTVEQLFRDYFEFTKGLAPDDAVLNIFKEVLAEEPED
ncbi:MAG: exonuclease subunit SbcD, partial [Bacteroidota bacterium]